MTRLKFPARVFSTAGETGTLEMASSPRLGTVHSLLSAFIRG
jgi:hypothetical protein